jgi:hypothetical protein
MEASVNSNVMEITDSNDCEFSNVSNVTEWALCQLGEFGEALRSSIRERRGWDD